MSPVRRLLVVMMLMTAGAFTVPTATRAQEVEGIHFTLYPWFGIGDFDRDTNFDDETIWGGTAGLGLNRYLAVEGHLGKMSTQTLHGFSHYAIGAPPGPPAHEVDVLNYGGDLVLNLIPQARLVPYLLAGWAESKFDFADEDSVPDSEYENGWELGGGIKFHFTPRIGIRLEVRDNLWTFPDGTPDPAGTDAQHNLFYTGGIQFAFGGSGGDDDKDGVSNNKDNCPATPAGAKVDASGCPIDSDRDGVPDGIDQCANTVSGATVDSRGCPRDSDSDGVPDGIDQCAETPSGTSVDERGCPRDADGDGVQDALDQCPNTPSGSKVDARGCPDADGDGVPDDKDRCPFTAAGRAVNESGCPTELTPREQELLKTGKITEGNIQFASGKADLLPESSAILDEIGSTLIQIPMLKIEVGGHADSRGAASANQQLSEKRAQAVLDYLVAKFPQITREQYSAKGYGESKPVASNNTAAGQAKNRRVEFKILNFDELKRELEQRQSK